MPDCSGPDVALTYGPSGFYLRGAQRGGRQHTKTLLDTLTQVEQKIVDYGDKVTKLGTGPGTGGLRRSDQDQRHWPHHFGGAGRHPAATRAVCVGDYGAGSHMCTVYELYYSAALLQKPRPDGRHRAPGGWVYMQSWRHAPATPSSPVPVWPTTAPATPIPSRTWTLTSGTEPRLLGPSMPPVCACPSSTPTPSATSLSPSRAAGRSGIMRRRSFYTAWLSPLFCLGAIAITRSVRTLIRSPDHAAQVPTASSGLPQRHRELRSRHRQRRHPAQLRDPGQLLTHTSTGELTAFNCTARDPSRCRSPTSRRSPTSTPRSPRSGRRSPPSATGTRVAARTYCGLTATPSSGAIGGLKAATNACVAALRTRRPCDVYIISAAAESPIQP